MKICDFGLARSFTKEDGTVPYSNDKITLWYRPPEVLLDNPNYDSKIDVWSAGCIFLNLLKHRFVICGNEPIDVLKRVIELLGARKFFYWFFIYSSWK